MKVLIIGATGGTGRQLVEQALTAGHEVTALVRNPGKIRARHERLRVVQGDILDFHSLDLALAGQDAVLSSLGTKSVFKPVKIFSEGTSNLLRAMPPASSESTNAAVGCSVLWIGASGIFATP